MKTRAGVKCTRAGVTFTPSLAPVHPARAEAWLQSWCIKDRVTGNKNPRCNRNPNLIGEFFPDGKKEERRVSNGSRIEFHYGSSSVTFPFHPFIKWKIFLVRESTRVWLYIYVEAWRIYSPL